MSFAFDAGSTGSDGPWLAWSARGTLDGEIPARSFYIREEGGKKTLFEGFVGSGVVLDIHKMKTGWQRSEGVVGQAPDWRWNASVARFEAQPGEDYKRGFSIPCAIGGGRTATWEQAGAAVWNAITDLAPELTRAPNDNALPLVKMISTKAQQFKRGSTVSPVLQIVKWVPRPDCLKEGATAGLDVGAAAPQRAAPAPQPVAPPAPANVPEDAEF